MDKVMSNNRAGWEHRELLMGVSVHSLRYSGDLINADWMDGWIDGKVERSMDG